VSLSWSKYRTIYGREEFQTPSTFLPEILQEDAPAVTELCAENS